MTPELALRLVAVLEGYFSYDEMREMAAIFEVNLDSLDAYDPQWLAVARELTSNLGHGHRDEVTKQFRMLTRPIPLRPARKPRTHTGDFLTHDPFPAIHYPGVTHRDGLVVVESHVGDVRHGVPANAFDVSLRVTALEELAGLGRSAAQSERASRQPGGR